jgi:hypothetical protein
MNDILGLLPAQVARALLTKAPPNGIDNVTFAAAVRTD